jgi:hypothetical protein
VAAFAGAGVVVPELASLVVFVSVFVSDLVSDFDPSDLGSDFEPSESEEDPLLFGA